MIPNFDHNNVLPPHLGNPVNRTDLSPYLCTSVELAERFGTNPVRIQLLKKFLNFRQGLRDSGLLMNCFQWVDGSFVEDKEAIYNSSPDDIDVLTFYHGYDNVAARQIVGNFPAFNNREIAKNLYSIDHFPINLEAAPFINYLNISYFTMLFNHSRLGVWKGILLLKLNTPVEDNQALVYLNGL